MDRIKKPELGGGGLHDIGIYPIQLATMVFNNEKPVKITADASLSDQGSSYYMYMYRYTGISLHRQNSLQKKICWSNNDEYSLFSHSFAKKLNTLKQNGLLKVNFENL